MMENKPTNFTLTVDDGIQSYTSGSTITETVVLELL